MQKVTEKLKEIESGEVGLVVYSQFEKSIVYSMNQNLIVPIASAAKVVIGYIIAKLVEEKKVNWCDSIEEISLNPKEDSHEIYPHLQNRKTLTIREAVEVMIACHDSFVANSIVQFCGGWDKVNAEIKLNFNKINIIQNPRNLENQGELSQLLELLYQIFVGYRENPELWTPIINGLVRGQEKIDGIPHYFLNHMTGGLDNVVIDIGIMGGFHQHPFLYVLGVKNLPNRSENQLADQKISEAMKLLYKEYLDQEIKNEILN